MSSFRGVNFQMRSRRQPYRELKNDALYAALMMNRRQFAMSVVGGLALQPKSVSAAVAEGELPDIRSIVPDLRTPPMEDGVPAPGKRVRQTLPAYAHTAVHHALYLPSNWRPDTTYPVLVEYAGNGLYTDPYGDFSSGEVKDCNLAYGITAGQDYLLLTLPFIDPTRTKNQLWWWGDVEATLAYCQETVAQTCGRFGGDRSAVTLCGFSRGAIACNYIGLHNNAIARLWSAFIPCSHYDGVRPWEWAGSDRASAERRLARLQGRPTFCAQEISTQDIQDYLAEAKCTAPFTFQTLPYRNHTDTWVLRDVPARRALRRWLADVHQHKLRR